MKILSLSNKLPYPPHDGGAIGFLNPLLGLSNAGNKVDVLAMNTSKHFFPVQNIPEDIRAKINITDVFADTSINPVSALLNLIFSNKPFNAVRFIQKAYQRKLIEMLQLGDYDVVQVEGLYTAWCIPIIRKYSKALISYRSHNIEFEIWERLALNESNLLKRWYLQVLAKRIKKFELGYLNSYDVLVPVTSRDGSIFNNYGNLKPVHVTLPGWIMPVNEGYFGPDSFGTVFHLGALDWFPNQEGLLWFVEKVWPLVNSQKPEAKFIIAGRNAPLALIDKFSRPGIEFVGEVPDSTAFMKRHAVMVVPLLSGSGIRIKIIEGMSVGKAIVTTQIGMEGIDAVHDKEILIADKAGDFANIVLELLNKPSKTEIIGRNACKFAAANFDLVSISKQLTGFYAGMLNSKE